MKSCHMLWVWRSLYRRHTACTFVNCPQLKRVWINSRLLLLLLFFIKVCLLLYFRNFHSSNKMFASASIEQNHSSSPTMLCLFVVIKCSPLSGMGPRCPPTWRCPMLLPWISMQAIHSVQVTVVFIYRNHILIISIGRHLECDGLVIEMKQAGRGASEVSV